MPGPFSQSKKTKWKNSFKFLRSTCLPFNERGKQVKLKIICAGNVNIKFFDKLTPHGYIRGECCLYILQLTEMPFASRVSATGIAVLIFL